MRLKIVLKQSVEQSANYADRLYIQELSIILSVDGLNKMEEKIQSVNEADDRRARFKVFYPEIKELKSVRQIENQAIIFMDGTIFEYFTPFGLKDTALILACLVNDRYNKAKWFKILTSGTVLVDQVRRWLKWDPEKKKCQFPVQGTLRFRESSRQKVPMWILENE